MELRQLLDGSWRIYYDDKLIATAESTEVGEPFKAKARRKGTKSTSSCEWVYLASRQKQETASGNVSITKMRRDPGKPYGATRIA